MPRRVRTAYSRTRYLPRQNGGYFAVPQHCKSLECMLLAHFSSPKSSPSPGVLTKCHLAEICSHEGQTEDSAASGAGMSPCSRKRHTGLHRGNRVAFSSSALSLFSIPRFLSRSLFVDGGAIRKLPRILFSFLCGCGIPRQSGKDGDISDPAILSSGCSKDTLARNGHPIDQPGGPRQIICAQKGLTFS